VLGLPYNVRSVPQTPKRIVNVKIVIEAKPAIFTALKDSVPSTTMPEAGDISNQRSILVIPYTYGNVGSVTVSHFEWAQNIQQFRWDEALVNFSAELPF